MPRTSNSRQPDVPADNCIEGVKPSFFSSLETQLNELKSHREQIAANEIDAESRQAMRPTVHALRGTAASYLYPELTETAGTLERLIIGNDPRSDDGFLALTDSLIKFCTAAMNEERAA